MTIPYFVHVCKPGLSFFEYTTDKSVDKPPHGTPLITRCMICGVVMKIEADETDGICQDQYG